MKEAFLDYHEDYHKHQRTFELERLEWEKCHQRSYKRLCKM